MTGILKILRWVRQKLFPTKRQVSYSQKGEDLIVGFLMKMLGISHPSYLDIGAYSPTHLSNTYFFYKAGSRGVCIEPNPELYREIKRKRKEDTCLNIGIGTSPKETKSNYYVMSVKTLSTFSKEEAEYLDKSTNKKIEKVIEIPLLPINNILREYFKDRPLNFVSLDTEGYDYAILKSWDFRTYRPDVFCIETLTYNEDKKERKLDEIINLMVENGYIVHADTYINTIFVDKQKWLNR